MTGHADEASYTHGHGEAVLLSHRWRTAENSAGYLLPRLSPGTSVLDVGCGPGSITADLAVRVAPGTVIGVDGAREVVTLAAAEHRAENLEFRTGNVHDLDFPADSFDVVHAHQVLQHLSDPVHALREMRRVCRPGGTVAVRDGDFRAMAWWPDHPDLERWRSLYRAVARANGGEPDAARRLRAWVHTAGFTDVQATASAWNITAPRDRTWWARTWAQRTTDSPLAERALELGLATATQLQRCRDAWLEWARRPDATFLVVHAEMLATS